MPTPGGKVPRPRTVLKMCSEISMRTRLQSVPVTRNVRTVTGTWIALKPKRVFLTPKPNPPPPVDPLRSHSETE
ncbi:hypothetical protein DFH28DRAFT_1138790 [Melampsora americana]|nr:hypothetical protein DFH28DRAFT_1138790 [Melampsora americana]